MELFGSVPGAVALSIYKAPLWHDYFSRYPSNPENIIQVFCLGMNKSYQITIRGFRDFSTVRLAAQQTDLRRAK